MAPNWKCRTCGRPNIPGGFLHCPACGGGSHFHFPGLPRGQGGPRAQQNQSQGQWAGSRWGDRSKSASPSQQPWVLVGGGKRGQSRAPGREQRGKPPTKDKPEVHVEQLIASLLASGRGQDDPTVLALRSEVAESERKRLADRPEPEKFNALRAAVASKEKLIKDKEAKRDAQLANIEETKQQVVASEQALDILRKELEEANKALVAFTRTIVTPEDTKLLQGEGAPRASSAPALGPKPEALLKPGNEEPAGKWDKLGAALEELTREVAKLSAAPEAKDDDMGTNDGRSDPDGGAGAGGLLPPDPAKRPTADPQADGSFVFSLDEPACALETEGSVKPPEGCADAKAFYLAATKSLNDHKRRKVW